MYKITKEFNLSYGHRVHTQKLDPEYTIDSKCACRFLHGHNSIIIIELQADQLNEQGMVLDFKYLNWAKQWIDNVLDHKFIMDINDPVRETLFPLTKSSPTNPFDTIFNYHKENYWTLDLLNKSSLSLPEQEIYEGLVFVQFVPTSENLSKWIFDIVQEKMKPLDVIVSSVKFYETPKSSSLYSV